MYNWTSTTYQIPSSAQVVYTITSAFGLYNKTTGTIPVLSTNIVMADLTFNTPIVMTQVYTITAISDPNYPSCTVKGSFSLYQISHNGAETLLPSSVVDSCETLFNFTYDASYTFRFEVHPADPSLYETQLINLTASMFTAPNDVTTPSYTFNQLNYAMYSVQLNPVQNCS